MTEHKPSAKETDAFASAIQKIGLIMLIAVIAIALLVGVDSQKDQISSNAASPDAPGTSIDAIRAEADADIDAAIAAAEKATSSVETTAAGPTQDQAKPDNWYYSERRDELRNSTVYAASVSSNDRAYFAFPYQGGSSLDITVRKHPSWGTDVVFQISKGQFQCGIESCKGTISFDGSVETLTLSPPEGYSPEVLFATYGPAIMRKLKSADRVVVELPFYQEGRQQFTFDTAGLEWDH